MIKYFCDFCGKELKRDTPEAKGLAVGSKYESSMEYYDIFFDKMNDEDKEYTFKVTYNPDESVICDLRKMGILGYSFSINSTDKKNVPYEKFLKEGEVSLNQNIENDFYKNNLAFFNPFFHSSVMLKAEVLKLNKYNSNFRYSQDYELWIRIMKSYKES